MKKLKTLIKELESARTRYIKKYGKEPVVWEWFTELELVHSPRKAKPYGTKAKDLMSFKVEKP